MATIDSSIALQTKGAADPLETYGRVVSLKSLANQQAMQEAQLAKYQQEQAAEQRLSDLYRQNVDPSGKVNRDGLLSSAASSGLGSRIPMMQKGFAEQDKSMAEAQKLGLENKQKGLEFISSYLPKMAANPNVTQQDVINAVAQVPADVLDPKMTAQFVRNLPSDPNQMRRMLIAYGQKADEQLAAMTPKFEKIDAGNRIVTGTVDPQTGQFSQQGATLVKAPEGYMVGNDGKLTVDPGFLDSKKQIAQAGKSVTNVNVNTEKTLLNTVAQGLGKQLDEGLSSANSAVSSIQSARQLRSALDSGKIIAGPGADAKILLTQIASNLGLAGKDSEETLSRTREVIQNLAQGELQAAQSMRGQGAITDAERILLKRAAGGDINMTIPELRTLANAIERSGSVRVAQHQSNVDKLKAVPGGDSLIPFYAAPKVPDAARSQTPQAIQPQQNSAPVQTWKSAGYSSPAQAVQDARSAIGKGADKATVIQRLEAAGITNHGIR